jgi:hypothetical protein
MTQQTLNTAMTIRRMDLTEVDRRAVSELAARDSSEGLEAPVLGVEVEGTLLAALSLSSGDAVADPFSRTDELRAMLELRAAHLRRRQAQSRRGLRLPGRRGRLAIAANPPGSVATLPR